MKHMNSENGMFPRNGGTPRVGSETRPRNVAFLPLIKF
jgi:hypothetical protein